MMRDVVLYAMKIVTPAASTQPVVVQNDVMVEKVVLPYDRERKI